MNDFPIIKPFVSKGRYFVYDTYKHKILAISVHHYMEVELLIKKGIEVYRQLDKDARAYKDIIALLDSGYLKSGFVKKVQHPEVNFIEYLTARCINQVVLQVTKSCNFKCRYCISMKNARYQNEHDNVVMEKEIARRSIDFLFDHSKDAHAVTVTFYGGEPLLNFGMIAYTVAYTNDKFKSKRVTYNMTTNASLMSDEIVDFFVSHEFSLLISLDGDAEVQNRHRKYLYDGGDTFDTVFKNISRLKERYPTYFSEQVRFNPVVFDDENENDVMDFFVKNEIAESAISIQSADLNGIDYLQWLPPQDSQDSTLSVGEVFKTMKEKFDTTNTISETWHHDGPCIPAVMRLFVHPSGAFYPCEKIVSEPAFSLGHLDTGIDNDAVIKMINIGELTQEECITCWAMRFCSMCVKECMDADSDQWTREQKLNACARVKENAALFLRAYVKESMC